jgi:hypothetical protein
MAILDLHTETAIRILSAYNTEEAGRLSHHCRLAKPIKLTEDSSFQQQEGKTNLVIHKRLTEILLHP